MNTEEYIPAALLRPFIKAYRIIESQGELINRVVPNTSFAIAFRLKGQISYISDTHKTTLPTSTFSGLRKSVRLINYAPETAALIVLLKKQAYRHFLNNRFTNCLKKAFHWITFFPTLKWQSWKNV